jgi:hypothetical protein
MKLCTIVKKVEGMFKLTNSSMIYHQGKPTGEGLQDDLLPKFHPKRPFDIHTKPPLESSICKKICKDFDYHLQAT